jgi:two-component system NtrC family sensor kinase
MSYSALGEGGCTEANMVAAKNPAEVDIEEEICKIAMRELEFQKIALDHHAIMSVADASGAILSVNDNFVAISQYSAENLLGQNHRILNSGYHPVSFFREMWSTISRGEFWQGEIRNRRKDGSFYWVESTIVPFLDDSGKPYKYVSLRTDVTRLKEAEEDLRAANEGLEQRVEERTAELLRAKEQLEAEVVIHKQMGVSLQKEQNALAEANVRMVLYHSTMERLREAEASFAESGDDDFCRHTLSDSMALTSAKYGVIGLFDASGKLRKFLTEGVSEEDRQKIGSYPSGKGLLHAFYQESKITRVDRIADDPRTCGFSPGHPLMTSLLGMPLLVNGVTKGVIYLADRDGGEPFTEQDEMLMEMLVDGVVHSLERNEMQASLRESNLVLIREREEQRLLIAKLEAAQSQLLQSEKMASIGQLAAGVAHEINNPIGYVYSNLGSLDKYIQAILGVVAVYEQAESAIASGEALSRVQAAKQGADLEFLREDIAALMKESREGITRVKKIVQDLKDFSHVDEAEWQWADIHQGLNSTLNIVWSEIKYKAEVVKEYGELPEVECLPSQLNQVFMNLLVNAAHAIEERGTITLRSGVKGEEVWVEIADTGKGIAPENLNRIFDPFFTTKPVGKGTGLGLSLSYSIMQKHHGRIEVASEVGVGTVFRVYLPVKQPEKKADQ